LFSDAPRLPRRCQNVVFNFGSSFQLIQSLLDPLNSGSSMQEYGIHNVPPLVLVLANSVSRFVPLLTSLQLPYQRRPRGTKREMTAQLLCSLPPATRIERSTRRYFDRPSASRHVMGPRPWEWFFDCPASSQMKPAQIRQKRPALRRVDISSPISSLTGWSCAKL